MKGDVGLLWRMEEGKSLAENAVLALRRHEMRYGVKATVLNANPDDLKVPVVVEGITVISVQSCQKGHLFVGRRI